MQKTEHSSIRKQSEHLIQQLVSEAGISERSRSKVEGAIKVIITEHCSIKTPSETLKTPIPAQSPRHAQIEEEFD